MESREGKLNSDTINWAEIFNSPEMIFTLDQNEYSSAQSVRSSGINYRSRHGLTGVLHVLENTEDPTKLDIQFSPREEETQTS